MKTSIGRFIRSALLLVGLVAVGPAFAQASNTWVSGVGDDANPCSRTAPCKTFAGAISKTATGGTINVLDPGGFGAVTITKSITINGEGHVSSILNAGSNGIVVNAPGGAVVVVRNISLNGAGTGASAIKFVAGTALYVEHVTIEGSSKGIEFVPTTTSRLFVNDTTIVRTTDAFIIKPTGVSVNASIDGLRLIDNNAGLRAEGGASAGVTVGVRNASVVGTIGSGINAVGSAGLVEMTIGDSFFAGNNPSSAATSAAVKATGASATVSIDNNTIVMNGGGLQIASGAVMNSSGNNHISDNTFSDAPTSAPLH